MLHDVLLPLADALPDPNSSAAMGWLIAALAACSVAGNQILGIVEKFRKMRGIDPDSDSRYPTREEHRELRTQVNILQGQHLSLQNSIQAELRDISRSLGRLEGPAPKPALTCSNGL